ncbi:hypothetical protein [Methylobacterium sp. ID0610]|uniref:hypothetical protein n=1 Tax=Methylobacterium carpenticola TaxID=3344827 RepID=UPI0036B4ED34
MTSIDAYNVFRRKEKPALQCAIRQDRSVPDFVCGGSWEYAGTISADSAPFGFKPKAARDATAYIGYYLFHTLNG